MSRKYLYPIFDTQASPSAAINGITALPLTKDGWALHPTTSESSSLTLFLLDSHEEMPNQVKDPDYFWIKQSQIDWFTCTSRPRRKGHLQEKKEQINSFPPHLLLAFMHIRLPEYAHSSNLVITGGQRRELAKGPSFNSCFYDILAAAAVAAVGCGHDHMSNFAVYVGDYRATTVRSRSHDLRTRR
ncbi:hypothetical protein LTR37_014563 [Vermiconidia calcicola]|uniref:Uncharacterized protein n=1 Tax=Vermiconidia calcicola TaxID=1690605 RepID=A0ACC3MVW7_9PEZI|nr:hypothetical protein LTR37_014563 [Vermiconidia calcicola]